MRYLILLGLMVMMAGCNTIHRYNIWTNIVYGSTFSDAWDCCAQLEESKNGKYEQVVSLEEINGKKYNNATYLFRAAYTHEDCKQQLIKKIKEWKKSLMKKPYTYKIE